jgi:hypothetical protein
VIDVAKKTLNDILAEDDEAGLLANLKPSAATASSEELRTRQKFNDINVFIDRNGRLPGETPEGTKATPSEKMLQYALSGIRGNVEAVAHLTSHDRHGLLTQREPAAAAPRSLEDILDSDDELLSTDVDDIFTFRRAPVPSPKAKPDSVAERRPRGDFSSFKPLFEACVEDLKVGRRKTLEFKNEQEIKAGEFFILNGTMIYVAEVNDPHLRNGKPNARLRLIFDNGTEGNNLLRSLSAELYKDGPAGRGRRVTAGDDGPLFTGRNDVEYRESRRTSEGKSSEAVDGDKETGEIYVLRSMSSSPVVRDLDGHLFKIGFTTGSVEERIVAAKDDPTFLLAPVRPVKTYRVLNMNTVKLENLLHRFFGDARLDIEIMDRFGKPCKPREWFLVPIEVVDRAIKMLIDGTIVKHRYDRDSGTIVNL